MVKNAPTEVVQAALHAERRPAGAAAIPTAPKAIPPSARASALHEEN